jgi:hypothetical protein
VELSRELVGLSEAMVALDGAAAYDAMVAAEAPLCDGSSDCSTLTEPCAVNTGCDDHGPAGLTGVAASPQETVLWAVPAERSTRRRVRATGRKQRLSER